MIKKGTGQKKMKSFYAWTSLCCLAMTSPLTLAKEIQGMSFSHQDWEVYCSNTGTCRAAGYQDDHLQNMPATILLTRKAGAKQTVQGTFALSSFDQALDSKKLNNLNFFINHQDYGRVNINISEQLLTGTLNSKQLNALLQQSRKKVNLVFKNAYYTWQVSDAGMTATLLKMDDFQKRMGTVAALVKPGTADESKVLAAQPKRVVIKVKTPEKPYLILQPKTRQYQNLHPLLMAARPTQSDAAEFCEGIYDGEGAKPQAIELYKLTNNKVLATTLCWRGAYNEGYGVWVINQSLTGKPSFVTESASDFAAGEISSAQKGRGIGDCWKTSEWIWQGQAFVQTVDRWSGMCKGFAGGAWDLDLIEAVVK